MNLIRTPPHKSSLLQTCVIVAALLAAALPAHAAVSEADAKSGIVDCTPAVLSNHNPGLAGKPDKVICFEGYISNFNTKPRAAKTEIPRRAALGGAPRQEIRQIARERRSAE